MKVIEYLKEHGIEKLEEEFSIIVKKYDEGLLVLNYNQIDSPKTHPIVMECRGLILDREYNIVSRSFDRFFNYGEAECTFNPKKATLYEKVDGSLIKIYYWNYAWHISTRGTAFAESEVNGWGFSFKEMVLRALNCNEEEFQQRCNQYLLPWATYICEVTGVENRVVTRYEGYSLWHLAIRSNVTDTYLYESDEALKRFGFKLPKAYHFFSVEECLNVVRDLTDLQEGYVAYEDGIPVCKIKSPKYVAVHHIRGEGLTPKRIAELVCVGEEEEYLTYYPEDEEHIAPYQDCWEKMIRNATTLYESNKHIEDQKEFALAVKDHPLSACIFMAKKLNKGVVDCFNNQALSYRIKVLRQEVEK